MESDIYKYSVKQLLRTLDYTGLRYSVHALFALRAGPMILRSLTRTTGTQHGEDGTVRTLLFIHLAVRFDAIGAHEGYPSPIVPRLRAPCPQEHISVQREIVRRPGVPEDHDASAPAAKHGVATDVEPRRARFEVDGTPVGAALELPPCIEVGVFDGVVAADRSNDDVGGSVHKPALKKGELESWKSWKS